jgi:hypothetical protein
MVTIFRKKVSKFFGNGHFYIFQKMSILKNLAWTFAKKWFVSIMQRNAKKDVLK